MIIEVTQADIDAGFAGDCWRCPIAVAMARATGVVFRVSRAGFEPYGRTLRGSCIGMVPLHEYARPLPDVARRFIAAYDCGIPCNQPFELELDDFYIQKVKREVARVQGSR